MTKNGIHHLRRVVLQPDPAGPTDGDLLSRFVEQRDEAAFAALVRWHSSMVWGVCRRGLTNHQDAEDAFQATFLVLARKAAAVVPRSMVANWLYGIAHHAALHAARTTARRKKRERQVSSMPEPAVTDDNPWPDLQPILDQELSCLPDKYRAVVVLCDLEGKGRKEAARQLGCPEGTVAGRLARARAMLAKRLTRRGVTLSSAALAAVLSQQAASCCAPVSVVTSTIKSASLFPAAQAASGAISANVAVLTERVLKMMLIHKLRAVATGLLVLAAFAVGAGLILYQETTAQEKPRLPAGPIPGERIPSVVANEAPPGNTEKEVEKEEPAKLAGTWKVTEFFSGERNLFLIKTEIKDAKLRAELAFAYKNQVPTAMLKEFRVEGKTIFLTIDTSELEFTFEGRLAGDGKKILGMVRRTLHEGVHPTTRNGYIEIGPAMLTITDAKTIADRDVMVQNLNLAKAMQGKGKERITAIQEILRKTPDTPAIFVLVHRLLQLSATEKDLELDYQDLVKRAAAVAAACGPVIERDEAMALALLLAKIDGQTDLALKQAQRAEKLLAKDAPLAEQERVLTMLENVLKTAGTEDKLKEVRGRLNLIEAELDKEYLAKMPPFKPTPATEHPKHGRVVVLELFVDAQLELSAAAEAAFAALLKTYPPGEVILLQYHQSRGVPDPLGSPDSDERSNYYRRLFAGKIKFAPAAVVNGKEPVETRDLAGAVEEPAMRRHYQGLRDRIRPWFDAEAGPKLKLAATEKEGKIDIQATVDDLDGPGKDKRLRLALVEEAIHYAGNSSIRIHQRVVRSMPGGPAGLMLKEASSKQTVTVDLAELKKQLAGYLGEVSKKRPPPTNLREVRPMDLRNLKVVALVQDDKTGEILQAAEIDLGARKKEK
jgi:RNA polymerase sigma factor (sigma-70 family)